MSAEDFDALLQLVISKAEGWQDAVIAVWENCLLEDQKLLLLVVSS